MRAAHQPSDAGTEQSPSDSLVLAEYEARRCHVCRCKYPSFGFGYPLTKEGQALWACAAHRGEVSRMLSGAPPP